MSELNGAARERMAIITGGSRGLGKNMVQGMGRRAAALQLDVGDADAFVDFVDRVRGVLQDWDTERFDFLVNNAGMGVHASIAETTEEQFDRLMDVHVKGPFFLTQKLLPLMAEGGRIVNVSTGLARFTLPGYAAYASAKGAVEVMTRYMALELGPRQIAVNTIAPGAIETDFSGGAVRDNPEMNEMVASSTALGRAGLPEDIGGVVASLLSPEMHWVNAQRIEASGGQSL